MTDTQNTDCYACAYDLRSHQHTCWKGRTDDQLFDALMPMIFVPASSPRLRREVEARNAEIEAELIHRGHRRVTDADAS